MLNKSFSENKFAVEMDDIASEDQNEKTKGLKNERNLARNEEFVGGFITGVFFNFFAITILFFIKSKHFKEGVEVGWIYCGVFAILIFASYLIDLQIQKKIIM